MRGRLAPALTGVLAALLAFDGAGCSRRAVSQVATTPSAGIASAATVTSPATATRLAAAPALPASPATLELWDIGRVRSELRRRRGHPLIVHMWASWCGPCFEELPAIDAFAVRARARGIGVLSLALDTDTRAGGQVPAVLRERAPHLTPIIARFDDAGPFMAMFSRDWEGTIPALFIFDRGGTLEKSVFDALDATELDRLLDQLTAPRPADGASTTHGPRP